MFGINLNRNKSNGSNGQYVDSNGAIMATGGNPNWSFALQDAYDSDEDGVGDFAGSVTVIQKNLDNINLRVNVWNNDDGGGPTNDTDGLIYVHSEARGPRRALCRIEMLLEGNLSDEPLSDYSAQEGAGPGKNFVSSDAEVISDFTQTSLSVQ